jgi:hypothetical protein
MLVLIIFHPCATTLVNRAAGRGGRVFNSLQLFPCFFYYGTFIKLNVTGVPKDAEP